ncbi:MAG: hypothetical protein CM15mP102_03730 [Flavobacteriales bacterium]|nr:MAG: hypothetical protein CM15mP102_03730 [Flavobacteriales bacterium]
MISEMMKIKIIRFIQKIYKEGITPTTEVAYEELGKELSDLWIFGKC